MYECIYTNKYIVQAYSCAYIHLHILRMDVCIYLSICAYIYVCVCYMYVIRHLQCLAIRLRRSLTHFNAHVELTQLSAVLS